MKPRTKPIVIELRDWNCELGRFHAQLVVRVGKLGPFIQQAIKAKGRRTLLARGGLEIRVERAPMEQLPLLEDDRP